MGKDNIGSNSIVVISDDEDENIVRDVVVIHDSDSDNGWQFGESIFWEPYSPKRGKANSTLPTTDANAKSDGKRKREANEGSSNAENHKKAKSDPRDFLDEGQSQKARRICTGKTTSHLYSTRSSSSGKKNAVGPGSSVLEQYINGTSTQISSSQSRPSTSARPLREITPGYAATSSESKCCPICPGEFSSCTSTHQLKIHFMKTHVLGYTLCTKCNTSFENKELREHFNQPEHAIACPYCYPREEMPANKLALHLMNIHDPHTRPWPCPIPECGTKVESAIHLVEHYRAKHYANASCRPGFACVRCGKKDLNLQSGLAHYIRDHNAVSNDETLRSLQQIFGVEWSLQLQLPPNEAPSLKDRIVVRSTTTRTRATSNKEKECMPKEKQNKGKRPMPKRDQCVRTKDAGKIAQPRQESKCHPYTTAAQELKLPCGQIENLSKFIHILFVDLDNWGKFFELPYLLPNVFVWGFCGGAYNMKKYKNAPPLYHKLVQEKRFFNHPKCGKSKNAADFALCVQAARLDLILPVHIPFTVLSGDKGFDELRMQLASSARKIHLVDPHQIAGPDLLNGILNSIGEQ